MERTVASVYYVAAMKLVFFAFRTKKVVQEHLSLPILC